VTAVAPYRSRYQSPGAPGKDGSAQALRAEWTKFRTVRGWVIGALAGVLAMAGIGLLASGGGQSSCQAADATAVFDRLATSGGWTAGPWAGQYIGAPETPGVVGYHQSDGRFTVTGQGDIAPVSAGHGGPADPAVTVSDYPIGTFAGLLALVVVAAASVTAEYRRGLIRLTFAATPARGRVLAAKAVVVAAVGFVAGLVGAAVTVLAGEAITRGRGAYAFPISGMTEARVIAGTAILTGICAVLAMAIGIIVRRGAAAVVAAISVIVLPYFLAVFAAVPLSAGDWLLRVMPAAGFALQQPYPAYSQVTAFYAPFSGYFPLAPWAGLAVLAAWTAAALALAACLLRRRDA
jgi:ABC-type transport system involved in multi-copper enzyme maturation permease subunit